MLSNFSSRFWSSLLGSPSLRCFLKTLSSHSGLSIFLSWMTTYPFVTLSPLFAISRKPLLWWAIRVNRHFGTCVLSLRRSIGSYSAPCREANRNCFRLLCGIRGSASVHDLMLPDLQSGEKRCIAGEGLSVCVNCNHTSSELDLADTMQGSTYRTRTRIRLGDFECNRDISTVSHWLCFLTPEIKLRYAGITSG